MNPWVIIGALVAVILAFFAGQHNGKRLERAAWLKKENVEFAAANKKIDELHRKARDTEAAHAAALDLISTTYQGELNAARAETKRLADAARAGTLRLRVRADCEGPGRRAGGEAAAAAGRRDGEASGELQGAATATLSGDDSAFLVELTGEADEVALQLARAQDVIVAQRKACGAR